MYHTWASMAFIQPLSLKENRSMELSIFLKARSSMWSLP